MTVLARLRRPLSGALAAGLLALTALFLASSPAAAHASLLSSDPGDGGRVDTLPARLELTFSEPMQGPAVVVITAPDGSTVADGEPTVREDRVVQRLGTGPEGAYTVAFRVVSTDGHPVTGEIGFRVGTGTSTQTAPSTATPGAGRSAEGGDQAEAGGSGADGVPAASSAGATTDGLWARHGTQLLVGAVLFGLAGLLLLASRRAQD